MLCIMHHNCPRMCIAKARKFEFNFTVQQLNGERTTIPYNIISEIALKKIVISLVS